MFTTTKILIASGVIFLLSGLWIFLASIDQSDFDHYGLLSASVPLKNTENGFKDISYTQENNFKLFSPNEINAKLMPHIYHKEWNESYVRKILNDHKDHINNVISASKFKRFKLQDTNMAGKMPQYASIVELFRLLLLQSIAEARAGNYDNSIYLAERAIVFSQQIKTEENHHLISYLVGQRMQYEGLLWVHHLATDYGLNQKQFSHLLNIFTYIPSYKEDSFRKVFSGEFLYTRDLMRSILDRSFSERRDDWKNSKDWWNSRLIRTNETSKASRTEEEIFAFLQVLFPHYYIQLNRASEESAKFFLKLTILADSPCKDTAFLKKMPKNEITWSDLFKPNVLIESITTSGANFSDFFSRRCYIQAHTEGVKTIVALKKFELNFGRFPDKLDELVPEYLQTLPVDPFTFAILKYSKLNKWVYSVGNNFLDNNGAEDAYYIWQCGNDKACSQNPTFPISLNSVIY